MINTGEEDVMLKRLVMYLCTMGLVAVLLSTASAGMYCAQYVPYNYYVNGRLTTYWYCVDWRYGSAFNDLRVKTGPDTRYCTPYVDCPVNVSFIGGRVGEEPDALSYENDIYGIGIYINPKCKKGHWDDPGCPGGPPHNQSQGKPGVHEGFVAVDNAYWDFKKNVAKAEVELLLVPDDCPQNWTCDFIFIDANVLDCGCPDAGYAYNYARDRYECVAGIDNEDNIVWRWDVGLEEVVIAGRCQEPSLEYDYRIGDAGSYSCEYNEEGQSPVVKVPCLDSNGDDQYCPAWIKYQKPDDEDEFVYGEDVSFCTDLYNRLTPSPNGEPAYTPAVVIPCDTTCDKTRWGE